MRQEDFITINIEDGIATIVIDNKKEKMNVVSPDVIALMADLSNQIERNDDIKGVIFISGKKDFMAGADVKSFQIEKEGDFRPFQAQGHVSLDRMEASKKPIVAAINGTAFGLGTELSLACHARVASNSPRTKLGLPEVKIGLLPGGGGTQRLPRLVGIQKALDMMLTGKNIYAYQAKKMGLVDELTDENKLHQAATIMVNNLLKDKNYYKKKRAKRKVPFMTKVLEGTGFGRNILFGQAKKMALKQSQGNYPAIPRIIECVETGYKKGLKAGYEAELTHFEALMLTPESAALRSLFFGTTANKKNPYGKSDKQLDTLGMIGAGFMGAGIAEISVNKGIDVLLKDIKDETLIAARKQIWKGLSKKIKYKTLLKAEAEEVMGRVSGQLTYESFDTADIVIEAVLEKMSLKKIIIGDIEKHCREDVIIASNTSSLSVTEMAKHAKRPERVIGMHYFSPVPKMPLLEIVKTEHTSDEVIAACYDFGVRQGKICIVVKDSPGFYVNRILAPYMNECLLMLDDGLAMEDIDKALKKMGFPVGPITLFDQVGLDIAAHVVDSSRKIVEDREGFEISGSVIKMFEDGRLGRKNSSGFYNYEKGKRKDPDQSAYKYFKGNGKQSLPMEEIQNRAVLLMVNEAVLSLEEGIIANPTDGDLGAVMGMGFLPFTGGPFRYMDQVGIANIVASMNELKAKYGAKFTPAKTLTDMAANGKTFH